MKFLHLSDLHLGKRVNEFSMIEDQKYILKKIINIIDSEKPDGILIAGDVYDKSVPSAEAIQLFDDFLTRIAKRKIETFIISGNHDSAERMSFASRLIDQSGIHISQVYDGSIEPFTLTDAFGEVNVYMLPFLKPSQVRRFFDGESIKSYTDSVRVVIDAMNIDTERRNVLLLHQFVSGSSRSDSEDVTVGGTDNVDVSVLEEFDYVALGHLHRPQRCTFEKIRYCGTPLKYSFSEVNDEKSVTVVELGEKTDLSVRTVPLSPLHDMVEIRGKYNELMSKSFYEGTSYANDYIHITLTDEDDIVNAVGKLRTVYKNLMKLDYDNLRTRCASKIDATVDIERKSPMQLFEEFYELQNNKPMTDEQSEFVSKIIEQIWEDET